MADVGGHEETEHDRSVYVRVTVLFEEDDKDEERVASQDEDGRVLDRHEALQSLALKNRSVLFDHAPPVLLLGFEQFVPDDGGVERRVDQGHYEEEEQGGREELSDTRYSVFVEQDQTN